MPSYAYRAYTEAGKKREGRIDAAGTSAAEQSLWLEGLKIIQLYPAPPVLSKILLTWASSRLREPW